MCRCAGVSVSLCQYVGGGHNSVLELVSCVGGWGVENSVEKSGKRVENSILKLIY